MLNRYTNAFFLPSLACCKQPSPYQASHYSAAHTQHNINTLTQWAMQQHIASSIKNALSPALVAHSSDPVAPKQSNLLPHLYPSSQLCSWGYYIRCASITMGTWLRSRVIQLMDRRMGTGWFTKFTQSVHLRAQRSAYCQVYWNWCVNNDPLTCS